MMTLSQLSALHDRVGDDMYAATGGALRSDNTTQDTNNTATDTAAPTQTAQTDIEVPQQTMDRPLTRAERMFTDLLGANWFTMNPDGEYDLFAFIDPNCPHCKELIRDAAIQMTPEGKIRYRIIPVGFQEDALKKAAVLLASGNPAERLMAYANGDDSQISVPQTINTRAAQNNTALMSRHNFDVTPIVVYRTKGGIIRLIRGIPQSYDNIRNDIDNN
jgi:thiol:disulfide interchange protein DsbG